MSSSSGDMSKTSLAASAAASGSFEAQLYPQVKGGTTERLVEWLTFHRFTGAEFRDSFLRWVAQRRNLIVDGLAKVGWEIPKPTGIDWARLKSISTD